MPALAQPGPVLAELAHVALEPFDAPGDGAAILLELGFAGPAGADAATLAREAQAAAAEAGQAVAQLGQFHLQPAGGAGGPLGKNVEDQFTAVAHGQIDHPLQVAGLHRGELPVGDHQGGSQTPRLQGGFPQLPLAPNRRGSAIRTALAHDSHRLTAGATHQPLQLSEATAIPARIAAGEHQEEHPLAPRRGCGSCLPGGSDGGAAGW